MKKPQHAIKGDKYERYKKQESTKTDALAGVSIYEMHYDYQKKVQGH